jgi:hypothetical protein
MNDAIGSDSVGDDDAGEAVDADGDEAAVAGHVDAEVAVGKEGGEVDVEDAFGDFEAEGVVCWGCAWCWLVLVGRDGGGGGSFVESIRVESGVGDDVVFE